jgi:hypothetical protein
MKRNLALIVGSLLLHLTTPVFAQSAGPPFPIFREGLQTLITRVINARSQQADDDTLVGSTPPLTIGKLPPIDERILKDYCKTLAIAKRRIYFLSDRLFGMSLQVRGIYTKQGMIFFQLAVNNHSHLDYDVDSIRFYVTDRQKLRKRHVWSIELFPLYIYGDIKMIRGKSREICVVAFPKFTLPANKRLAIQVLEKNGGRHLQLWADNFSLMRARLI